MIEKNQHRFIFANFNHICEILHKSGSNEEDKKKNVAEYSPKLDKYIETLHETCPENTIFIVCGFSDVSELRERIAKQKEAWKVEGMDSNNNNFLTVDQKLKIGAKTEEIVFGLRQGFCHVVVKTNNKNTVEETQEKKTTI